MAQLIAPALLGVVLFLIGWFQFRKVRVSRSWPSVTGRILDGKVEMAVNPGGADEPDSTSYFPAIHYEYLVGSQLYRGDRIAFEQTTYPNAKKAQQALLLFPAGASVPVYYDPSQPSSAVLQRKATGGTVVMVLGAVLVLAALAAAFKR
jgi:hypothetical protein